MREIKFRGKHRNPYGDNWVHGYYALEDCEHVIIMPHSSSYKNAIKEKRCVPIMSIKHTIDINTLGQFTGLHDKNGKEIYEGDIVEYEDWESCWEGGGNDSYINRGVIEYIDENCCFNVTERETAELGDVLYEGNDTLEVIR